MNKIARSVAIFKLAKRNAHVLAYHRVDSADRLQTRHATYDI